MTGANGGCGPWRRSAAVALLAVLAGCAVSPEPRLYTLSVGEAPAPVQLPAGAAIRLVVEPARLGELIDRPQWILRRSPNEVSLLELQRWAAPLRREIPRVVAENLALLLPDSRVQANGAGNGERDAFRVGLDVLAFESTASGEVKVDVDWRVSLAAQEVVNGRSRVIQASAGGSHPEVAAAFSRALALVSADIARALAARLGER